MVTHPWSDTKHVTREKLMELLEYYPDSGLFVWKQRTSARVRAGSLAGVLDSKGYVIITYDRKPYKAHRLAWLYMTGEFPKQFIDHVNMVPADNRWDNLREATRAESNVNRRSRNSTGFKGVRRTIHGKFVAQLNRKYLATFDTPEEAYDAYSAAAKEQHGEFFNGVCRQREE